MLKSILLVPTVELEIAAGYRVAVELARRCGAACDDLYVSISNQTESISAMAGEGGLGWYVADLQEREEAWRKSITAVIDRARSEAGVDGRSLEPDGTFPAPCRCMAPHET